MTTDDAFCEVEIFPKSEKFRKVYFLPLNFRGKFNDSSKQQLFYCVFIHILWSNLENVG